MTEFEKRQERAKAMVRLEMLIIRAFVDALDDEETSAFLRMHRGEFAVSPEVKPIGFKRASVWRLKVHLGLETGRGNNQHQAKRKRTGRRDSKAALLEVRP